MTAIRCAVGVLLTLLIATSSLFMLPAASDASPAAAPTARAERESQRKSGESRKTSEDEDKDRRPTATKAAATATKRPPTQTPKATSASQKSSKPTGTPTPKATATATPKRTSGSSNAEASRKSSADRDNEDRDRDNEDDDDDGGGRRASAAAAAGAKTPTPTASPSHTPTLEPTPTPTPTEEDEEESPLSLEVVDPTPVHTPEPTPVAEEPAAGTVLATTVQGPTPGIGSQPYPSWSGSCGRALQYWELVESAARAGGADSHILAALLAVEGSGERAVSPAGAMGLMQLMPDKFRPGDDPFDVRTNLLRASQHVALLQGRYGAGERVAAAYFGAIDRAGNVTGASDGNVDGFEYVRRFQAALGCVQSGLGLPGASVADLVSPLGVPITPAHVSFDFLDDYGPALARYIRGLGGVEQHGTRHLAWDLIIPGAPANGRGYPVLAPLAGRIVRTGDHAGGPFGIWIENPELNLRVRLMHMDGLAPGVVDGGRVRAGQLVGSLGGRGTEEFPHLHLSIELLSTGRRLDPARFFFRSGTRPLGGSAAGRPFDGPAREAVAVAADSRALSFTVPGLGAVSAPRAWGNTVVWLADAAEGRALLGYDLELGWAFRIGSPAARGQSGPAIAGDVVAWLDARHTADYADYGGDPEARDLVDVYAYDLRTGRERRLTAVSGRYSDLVVSEQAAAWVSREPNGVVIQVRDLPSDRLTVVTSGAARPGELTISGSLIAWTERPAETPDRPSGDVRVYDLSTGEASVVRRGVGGRPAIAGSSVFWEERVGAGAERLVRGRELQTGREWTVTPARAARRGLRAADNELLWEEAVEDGRVELRSYGLSAGETRKLAERPAGSAYDAAPGRGTVVWREAEDSLAIASLLDWDVPGGRFYADRSGDDGWAGPRGFGLTNEGGIPFFDEYLRLGGAEALGRPVSGRILLADELVYTVTERGLLQWRPDLGRVVPANPMELLQAMGRDEWLHARQGIPRAVADGADSADPREARLAWLTDPRIREAFLANPDPTRLGQWTAADAIERYGLPMAPPARRGDEIVQRFQRAVLVRGSGGEHGIPIPDEVTAARVGLIFRRALLEAVPPPDHPR